MAATGMERPSARNPRSRPPCLSMIRIMGSGAADPSLSRVGPDRTNVKPFVQKRLQEIKTLFAGAKKMGRRARKFRVRTTVSRNFGHGYGESTLQKGVGGSPFVAYSWIGIVLVAARRGMSDELLVGVDGGGTNCRVRVRHVDGSLVGEAQGGTANVFAGLDAALDTIVDTTRQALERGGLDAADLSRCTVGLGLAGANVPSVAEALHARRLPFAAFGLETDAVTACRGAFAGGEGGIAILGTGTAYCVRARGALTLLGGWGMLVSDQGSGADLGRRALAEALLALDGARPAPRSARRSWRASRRRPARSSSSRAPPCRATSAVSPLSSGITPRPAIRRPTGWCAPCWTTSSPCCAGCWRWARRASRSSAGRPRATVRALRPTCRRCSSSRRATRWKAASISRAPSARHGATPHERVPEGRRAARGRRADLPAPPGADPPRGGGGRTQARRRAALRAGSGGSLRCLTCDGAQGADRPRRRGRRGAAPGLGHVRVGRAAQAAAGPLAPHLLLGGHGGARPAHDLRLAPAEPRARDADRGDAARALAGRPRLPGPSPAPRRRSAAGDRAGLRARRHPARPGRDRRLALCRHGRGGRHPVRALQRIGASNLAAEEAALLDVAPGTAALSITRVSFDAEGRPVEFTRSHYRGDAYDFVAELSLSTKDPHDRNQPHGPSLMAQEIAEIRRRSIASSTAPATSSRPSAGVSPSSRPPSP